MKNKSKRNRSGRQSKRENKQVARAESHASVIKFTESDIKQRWLLTTELCPTCGQAMADYSEDIKSGKLKVTEVGDEKGFDIITKLNLFETPVFIIELNDGRYLIDE